MVRVIYKPVDRDFLLVDESLYCVLHEVFAEDELVDLLVIRRNEGEFQTFTKLLS